MPSRLMVWNEPSNQGNPTRITMKVGAMLITINTTNNQQQSNRAYFWHCNGKSFRFVAWNRSHCGRPSDGKSCEGAPVSNTQRQYQADRNPTGTAVPDPAQPACPAQQCRHSIGCKSCPQPTNTSFVVGRATTRHRRSEGSKNLHKARTWKIEA